MFGKAIVQGMLAAAMVSYAVMAQASVFNLGGTLNPTTGTWTGEASLQFVTVGNPGNAADTTVMSDNTTGYGSVPYVYQMGKYDVTAGQYTAFLNAVAATDTYGLYNSGMAVVGSGRYGCGIIQSGISGSYTYSVATAYQNFPVVIVSWGDAARFCNWLQNGQLTGVEGNGTTETGAYTLTGDTTTLLEPRNAGAKYVIPSENEWYKAAYYDPTLNGGAGGYWAYPTKSNTAPSNVLSATGTNNANFWNNGYTAPATHLTPVGAFAASPGPYDTYDMGGDVWEWNEAILDSSSRGLRGGGCYYGFSDVLASSCRGFDDPTTVDNSGIGFRVASVPEPAGLAMLAGIALTAMLYWCGQRTGGLPSWAKARYDSLS